MDPYIGEIRLFAGNYAPSGWAFCNGDTLPVIQNQALYTIIGNTFGGTVNQTFGLPDLRGKAPIHQGTGNGLTPRPYNSAGGETTVLLTLDQIANHSHEANSQSTANETNPIGAIWANVARQPALIPYSQTANTSMNTQAVGTAGGSQAHNNMQPYMGINYIIALEGVYPVKSS